MNQNDVKHGSESGERVEMQQSASVGLGWYRRALKRMYSELEELSMKKGRIVLKGCWAMGKGNMIEKMSRKDKRRKRSDLTTLTSRLKCSLKAPK